MSIPAGPMELRKKFHRLTHICSIRPQWNFCNDTFSYVRMIHFKPWKPIFQCKFKKHVFDLFFNWKKMKKHAFGLFSILIQKKNRFWSCFFRSKNENQPKTVFFWILHIWIPAPKTCFFNSNLKYSSKTTFLNWMDLFRLFWAAFSI